MGTPLNGSPSWKLPKILFSFHVWTLFCHPASVGVVLADMRYPVLFMPYVQGWFRIGQFKTYERSFQDISFVPTSQYVVQRLTLFVLRPNK